MAENWLVIETSSRVGQLGLARNHIVMRSELLEESRRHARDLAAKTAAMLLAEGLKPRDIFGVMVSIGPGSYTGLRVGIASAKAFAYATGCKLVAVPTFTAIALQAPPQAKHAWVIADALQGLIYRQAFEFAPSAETGELRIDRAAEVLPLAPVGVWLTGPGVKSYADLLPPHASLVPEADREPRLGSVYEAGRCIAPATRHELFALEPLYLRGSSAEEKAKAREPRG
jgi:tRNA threonylcarbamoyladenosine biosynthesis protein TsaB